MYFSVVGRIRRHHVDRRRRRRRRQRPRRKAVEVIHKQNKKKKGDIHIPEEVMEQILSRVSVRSVLRFKCVRKAWSTLLSSKDFTFLHHNTYKPCDITLADFSLESGMTLLSVITLPTTRGCAAAAGTMVKHIRPEVSKIRYDLGKGNCKGIFSFCGIDGILLWNPAYDENKVIPLPNITYQVPQNYITNCRAKLGFDPIANDFKVLYIRYHHDHYINTAVHYYIHLHLYSLSKNSWRNLDASTLNSLEVNVFRPCFSTNTKIVWVAGSESIKLCLCLFDLSSETFYTIPVPIEDDIALGDVHVFPFGDSVAAVINQPPQYSGCFEILALNDLSCCTQSRSWSKLCRTTHHRQCEIHPIGFWGSSFFIFRAMRGDSGVVLYDLVNQVAVDFGTRLHNGPFSYPFVYQESLIRISDNI